MDGKYDPLSKGKGFSVAAQLSAERDGKADQANTGSSNWEGEVISSLLAKTIVVILGFVAVACAPQLAPVPTNVPTLASAAAATGGSRGITLIDDAGRQVTLDSVPQRIVSLAPSTTEIAFALGFGNRVIAVDTFSDYPIEAKNLPKIKTFPLNFEQVVSLQPDLVLAAGIQAPDDIKKLADLKMKVLVVGSSRATFDGVMTDILMVGKATGTELQARAVVDGMKQKLDKIKGIVVGATTQPKVYWELDATDPTKPFTPGPGSFIDDIIALAGGKNIAASAKSPYAQLSTEEIIAANPDVIILSDAAYGITPDSVQARGGWGTINAVKNNKVLAIDDNLVSRPGPRIVDGLDAATRLIHPELFR